jgi:hypothetical protein
MNSLRFVHARRLSINLAFDVNCRAFLIELDLSYDNMTDTKSFFEYKNVNFLRKLFLQGTILGSTLHFLNKHVNLVEIDLSSALQIKWDNRTIFSQLTNLTVLKLRDLNLSSWYMEKYLDMSNLPNLARLDLSSNRLEYFSLNLRKSSNLKYLSLANNFLKSLDLGLLPSNFELLDLSFNNLDYLNLTFYSLEMFT